MGKDKRNNDSADMGDNALSLLQILPNDQQFKLAFIDVVGKEGSWYSRNPDFEDFTKARLLARTELLHLREAARE